MISMFDVMFCRENKFDIDFDKSHDFYIEFDQIYNTGGGTDDYNKLRNRPSIEGVLLEGNKMLPEIGVDTLSVQEIEKILYLN